MSRLAWHDKEPRCIVQRRDRIFCAFAYSRRRITVNKMFLTETSYTITHLTAFSDWNGTDYYADLHRIVTNGSLPGINGTKQPEPFSNWVQILPLVMQHLCPPAVSIIGIGAISAAVMSSADSICLAIGSIFSKNIYKNVIRPKVVYI